MTKPDSINSFTLFLLKDTSRRQEVSLNSDSLRALAQPFEQLPPEFLKFAEPPLVLHKKPVILQRMVGIKMRAQHHVAQTNGIWQHSVFVQLFQRSHWVVMIHRVLDFRCVP